MENRKITESKSKKLDEELGWSFNNEIVLTLQELELLKDAKERIEQQSSALGKRIEALDAIQKFINRSK